MENYRLLDIGNTTASFYKNGKIKTVRVKKFKNIFKNKKFYYINVNHSLKKRLKKIKNGINLESYIKKDKLYKGLGVDRVVVCKAIKNGVIVDAGSAITVDIVEDNRHIGGFILLGFNAIKNSYKNISKVLKYKESFDINLNSLPQNTNQALNYATLKSIILPIKEVSKGKTIYFTGGDGKKLSKFFKNSKYNKKLIFKAMKKIIKERDANSSTSKR